MSLKDIANAFNITAVVLLGISVILFGVLIAQSWGEKLDTLPKWSYSILYIAIIGLISLGIGGLLRYLHNKKEKQARTH